MILSPEKNQNKALNEALLSAFDHNGLAQMLKYELDENLGHITSSSGNLREIVFDVMQWAERQGRLEDLVKGAYKRNSRNPVLKVWVETHMNHILPEPPSGPGKGKKKGTVISTKYEQLFVNRKMQLDGFKYMLSTEHAKRYMFIEAGKDMGKSWLILEMNLLAQEKGIPRVYWDFSIEKKDYVELIIETRNMLSKEYGEVFKNLNELIQSFGLGSNRNKEDMLAHAQLKITDEFITCLDQLSKNQRILFLLDGLDQAIPYTREWIIDLLTSIFHMELANILVVITAQEMPPISMLVEKIIGRTGLSLFELEHIRSLLKLIKDIYPDVNFSSSAEELYHLTNGHPGKVGNELDKILALRLEKDTSIDWMSLP